MKPRQPFATWPRRHRALLLFVASTFGVACAHGLRPFCNPDEEDVAARRDCLTAQRHWDDLATQRAAERQAAHDPNRTYRDWLRREVLTPSSSQVGRLVIYRVSGEGGPESSVWVNGQRVGRIDSNDFGSVEVSPGRHEVAVSSTDGVPRRTVDVGAGGTAIVRATTLVPDGSGEVSAVASAFMGPGLSWAVQRKARSDARRAHLGEVSAATAVRQMGDEQMNQRFNRTLPVPSPPAVPRRTSDTPDGGDPNPTPER